MISLFFTLSTRRRALLDHQIII